MSCKSSFLIFHQTHKFFHYTAHMCGNFEGMGWTQLPCKPPSSFTGLGKQKCNEKSNRKKPEGVQYKHPTCTADGEKDYGEIFWAEVLWPACRTNSNLLFRPRELSKTRPKVGLENSESVYKM